MRITVYISYYFVTICLPIPPTHPLMMPFYMNRADPCMRTGQANSRIYVGASAPLNLKIGT